MIRFLSRGADHALFLRDGAPHLFLAEGALVMPLGAKALAEDGTVAPDLSARIGRLAKELRERHDSHRSILAARAAERRPRLDALNLNLTPRCELSCVYCYAKGGSYNRIDRDLTLETVERCLDEAAAFLDPEVPFRFEFFGGEPLLAAETIEAVLAFEGRRGIGRGRVTNRISTSLTRLDERILRLLEEGEFIVSVSLDGERATQDAQRPFRDGRGSFDAILAAVERVRDRLPAATIVARMTAFSAAERLHDEIRSLRERGLFDYVSVYGASLVEAREGRVFMSAPLRDSLLALARAYPEWVGAPGNRFKGWLELNRMLGHLLDGSLALNHCRAGDGYFTLSPDGSMHPCHRLVGDLSRAVPGGAARLDRTDPAWRTGVDARDSCASCEIRYFCGGGCKQENLAGTGDMLVPAPGGCAFARLLFEAALEAFLSLDDRARRAVRKSVADLPRLFTLCGQETAPGGDREAAESRARAALRDYLI